MQIIKKIQSILGTKPPMQRLYQASVLPAPLTGLAAYPRKEFLAGQGVYAYRLQFMQPHDDVMPLLMAMHANFPSVGLDTFQEGEHHNSRGEAMHFAIRPEFNGATVEMLTNSRNLLWELDALQLMPPAPWVSFPQVEPDTLGSLQGAMEFWWNWYWAPFWDVASPVEREAYLVQQQASAAWTQYLKLRSTTPSPA